MTMADQIRGSINAQPVETDEASFVPGRKTLTIVMEPATSSPALDVPKASVPDMPKGGAVGTAVTRQKNVPVAINVETTGLNPWDSRIIHVSLLDPSRTGTFINFTDPNESKLINDFARWYENSKFNALIGYNVSFDLRFIFVKCMRYKVQAARLFRSSLIDVAQIMEQVKEEFVYGYNRPGSLDTWAAYFFNEKPPMSQEEVFKAWEEERYEDVRAFNEWKAGMTNALWVLGLYAKGEVNG